MKRFVMAISVVIVMFAIANLVSVRAQDANVAGRVR